MIPWVSKILGFTGRIITYGCVTHCTFEYLGDFVVCNGPSMQPTLYSDDILLTERISPRLSNISKGDIIIAKCPTNSSVHICKRVVGKAGDKISVQLPANSGMLNDEGMKAIAIRENVYEDGKKGKPIVTYVPRGHVWLEGDNQSNSTDSRSYGPVPEGLIKSRVLCRLWPVNKITLLT